MHEVKLARQVFGRLMALTAEHKLKKVKKVVLRVCELESENGEVLSAALKHFAARTPLEKADVEIIGARSEKAHDHDHDHDHDHPHAGLGEVIIERIEA